jgi:hypothetical protein
MDCVNATFTRWMTQPMSLYLKGSRIPSQVIIFGSMLIAGLKRQDCGYESMERRLEESFIYDDTAEIPPWK